MGDTCTADELRTLFLFERLTDDQLATLCAQGWVQTFPPGYLIREGEPATHLYVMIDGDLVMSGRMGGVDIHTHRTSDRGVYCGAWLAYVPDAAQVHEVSIVLTRPSRFFVLAADRFAAFMQSQFPIAVHLLAGHTLGTLRQQQLLGQRARLMALGTITAGLTHHLNNPAAAIIRAAADLHGIVGRLRHKLAVLADAAWPAGAVHTLVDLQGEVTERAGAVAGGDTGGLEAADREEAIGAWLDDHGVAQAWDIAATFAEAGLDLGWMARLASATAGAGGTAGLPDAVAWLKDSLDAELRIREITEAGRRVSTLLAGAKQYSQLDRGAYRNADVNELLESTLMMFEGRVGMDSRVALVTQWDPKLPEISCYPGDLNQV